MLQWRSTSSAPWGFLRGRTSRDPGLEAVEEEGTGVALYELPAELRLRNSAVKIVTPHECWSYALYLPPQAVPAQSHERFRVRLAVRVLSGGIGAGVLRTGRAGFHDYATATRSRGKPW